MFEFIPSGTKIPFMKFKMPMAIFSLVLTFGGFYFMATKGFNFGVDFKGGVEMIIKIPESAEPNAQKLRNAFEKMGIKEASVQEFGTRIEKNAGEYIIHFAADFADPLVVRARIEEALKKSQNTKESPVANFKFTGLEKAYLTLKNPIPFNELKAAVSQVSFGLLELTDFQAFGRESSNEYQLSFQNISAYVQRELSKDFQSAGGQVAIEKVDFVGARVGSDLKFSALMSLILTAILIFFYIFIRFDLVYAPGVVLSLIHDVTITAGIFALYGLDFDLTVVAALLTLAGYSINDTIIVYDRIREVAGIYKGKRFEEIIDISVNQTLSRTIITSGTVFLTALALWIWGGPVIHNFSTALLVGVVVGTYSSIFVAAPTILFTNWLKHKDSGMKKAA